MVPARVWIGRLALVAPLLATACEQPAVTAQGQGSTTPRYERVESRPLEQGALPVRIGESGPNFAACKLPAGATFFVCSRSIDQKWFGIVFDDAGTASPSCGVSAPVAERGAYRGPCRSGWIASAFVKLGGV
jgi:hypothetical protein